nr:thioredoxin domain-containing protein [uncultured Psychroserpens sp.]
MLKKNVFSVIVFGLLLCCSQKNSDVNIEKDKKTEHANDLIHETSPYLLQHAYNPVEWKAWSPKTLKLAQDENKLIIISVGYSACHWCHVMEEESFENDSVAKLMNEDFINIKVDREERPDVDQVYMNAVQLMTGSGGWPLNCIALPDGRPVFGGTYFTKTQWTKILEDMSSLYKNDPEKVIAYAEKLTEGVKNSDLITVNKENVEFNSEQIEAMVDTWKSSLDYKFGGQNRAPKFPMPSNLNALMRYSFQYDNKELQEFVTTTLIKMSNGGIYDQIGGGFSRYSVDNKWHVPHFEKMLYDNAQLVSLYADAYQWTKNEAFKTVALETLEFIDKELTHEDGGFYSSLDADSKTVEGILEEGAFYTWTKEELKKELDNDFDLFKAYYNINATGEWEKNQYILYRTKPDNEFLKSFDLTQDELNIKISAWKAKLFKVRSKRERPRTDDKILTSWNALMLSAYVKAYRVFDDASYLEKAIINANFLKQYLMNEEGALFHNYKDGKRTITGFSEDYAHTISAFIELYQVTLDESWLGLSKDLTNYCLSHFLDKESSMFYFTSDTDSNLIARKFEVIDNVIPSSNSVLAESLFKLSHYYSEKEYSNLAMQMLSNMNEQLKSTPSGYSNWFTHYLNYSNPYYEVAISGSNALDKLKEVNNYYIPNILIAGASIESQLPIMENRFIEDDTYIYVCVNGACRLPVTDVKEAVAQLSK